MYRLEISNFGNIKVTDEHLIFTDKGCVKFEDIRKNSSDYKVYGVRNNFWNFNLSVKETVVKDDDIELFDIVDITYLYAEDVYDISIEDLGNFFLDEHNYIANSIVVHNSHAAGIVVSDVPLEEIAPLRLATKGVLATQFPNEDLESLGLIKFDILAISTLSVIQRTVQMVKDYWKIDIDWENLPLDDAKTL